MAQETFSQFVETNNLDADTFPHAPTGLATLRVAIRFMVATLVVWLLRLVSAMLFDNLSGELDGGMIAQPTSATQLVQTDAVLTTTTNMLGSATAFLDVAYRFCLLVTVILLIAYLILIVMRWRSWERDVVRNDFRAMSLKRNILSTLAVDKAISAINKRYHQGGNWSLDSLKGKGGSSSQQKEMSFEDESRLNALKELKRMRVYVNTRQSVDGDEIVRRYQVIIKVPFVQKESDDLQSVLKDFDKVATRMESGRVSFGSQVVSADQSTVSYADSIVVPDKYAFEVTTEDNATSYGESEYVYPLSLFIDNTDKIRKAEKGAKKWSFRTAEEMDDLLTTLGIAAKRIEMHCGSRNVQYKYAVSFRPNDNTMGSLAEQLDRRFDTSGTTAEMAGNRLTIVIGLPDALVSPIDVSTLYRKAFG